MESKRGNQTNQSVVNGHVAPQPPIGWPSSETPSLVSNNSKAQPISPLVPAKQLPPAVNGAIPFQTQKDIPPFTPQIQSKRPFETSQIVFSPAQPTFVVSKPPLSAPVPQRAKISPVLNFQSPKVTNESSETQNRDNIFPFSGATTNHELQLKSAAPFTFSTPFSASFSTTVHQEIPKDDVATNIQRRQSPSLLEDKQHNQTKLTARRQSLFERQEKLLHEELVQQERDRKSKLDLAKRVRQESLNLERQRTIERNLVRQRESALLESQKMATKEREKQERIRKEQQKAQREKNVEFYTEEIVNSIVQEHILEVNADVLAVGFYRKWLLTRVMRHLKKICARSVGRKQLQLEEIKQSQNRKRLLARALGELETGESISLTKKPRRRSHRLPLETEDEFEEILNKVCRYLRQTDFRRLKRRRSYGSLWICIECYHHMSTPRYREELSFRWSGIY